MLAIKQRVDSLEEFHLVVSNQIRLRHHHKTKSPLQQFANGHSVAQVAGSIGMRIMTIVPRAGKAMEHEHGSRLTAAIGCDDQNPQIHLSLRIMEAKPDIFSGSLVTHELPVDLENFSLNLNWHFRFRHDAINQVPEERDELRASNLKPLLRRGDKPTLGRDEHRRQLVGRHLGLIANDIQVTVLGFLGLQNQQAHHHGTHPSPGTQFSRSHLVKNIP